MSAPAPARGQGHGLALAAGQGHTRSPTCAPNPAGLERMNSVTPASVDARRIIWSLMVGSPSAMLSRIVP